MNHPDAPNTPKIESQLDALKRLRAAGRLPVGWADGEINPVAANAFVKAGLATIAHDAGTRYVVPTEQSQ